MLAQFRSPVPDIILIIDSPIKVSWSSSYHVRLCPDITPLWYWLTQLESHCDLGNFCEYWYLNGGCFVCIVSTFIISTLWLCELPSYHNIIGQHLTWAFLHGSSGSQNSCYLVILISTTPMHLVYFMSCIVAKLQRFCCLWGWWDIIWRERQDTVTWKGKHIIVGLTVITPKVKRHANIAMIWYRLGGVLFCIWQIYGTQMACFEWRNLQWFNIPRGLGNLCIKNYCWVALPQYPPL